MKSTTEAFQPPDLVELARFDTPTICNAIELFDVRSPTAGYMDRRIAACFPDLPPIVGFAATATFRSAEPARLRNGDPNPSAGLLKFITDLPGPAIVVFQDLDDPPAGATFGDGMCLTYKITVRDAGDVRSDVKSDPNNDADDVGNPSARQEWILGEFESKGEMRKDEMFPGYKKQFGLSKTTLERDLNALRRRGLIRFDGEKRTGRWRRV